MFTIYIDDSGTAPSHKMAIAAGIILPALRIGRFESEWNAFLEKQQLQDHGFHASECLARNQHSAFASWDDDRVARAFARVRQITFKYSIRGFCVAIHKQDYDEVLTPELKAAVGDSYYSWAVSSLLGTAHDWATTRNVSIEYVFDNADKSVKKEIESSIEFSNTLYPGHFVDHYSFRSRKQVPGLQAVDLFAWTCYQAACRARFNQDIHPLAHESAVAFHRARGGVWQLVQSLNRGGIEEWVNENRNNPRTQEIIEFKKALRRPDQRNRAT